MSQKAYRIERDCFVDEEYTKYAEFLVGRCYGHPEHKSRRLEYTGYREVDRWSDKLEVLMKDTQTGEVLSLDPFSFPQLVCIAPEQGIAFRSNACDQLLYQLQANRVLPTKLSLELTEKGVTVAFTDQTGKAEETTGSTVAEALYNACCINEAAPYIKD